MTSPRHLDLVLLWHMHQPDYRDIERNEYALPWTYLHALKDYTDMVAHLERHPAARAVVNFVPILLDQLADYADQITQGNLRDPLLRLLAHPDPDSLSLPERQYVLATCFRSNHRHMLEPYAPYRRLRDLYTTTQSLDVPAQYLSGAYFADLLTWYHLAWTGESVRREHPWVAELITRGEGFSKAERGQLLQLIGSTLANLAMRYQALENRGQIELSTTPYAHPLAPLLLDFTAGREAIPDLVLPEARGYPGGAARLDQHCAQARAVHRHFFERTAIGVWPAEGAVSAPLLSAFAQQEFRWVATGEAVLANTLHRAGRPYERQRDLYRPWRDASGITVFFRDDRLSDLIGFEYAKWDGAAAAEHFVGELEAILAATADDNPLVCIALDGENAWEHYPFNAHYFLDTLYARLAAHTDIVTTTFATMVDAAPQVTRTRDLPRVCAGSWVYGTLSTWIGDPDKNRAWDLLCAAKVAYDERAAELDPIARTEVDTLLTLCEGSDWFWWLGDYNPAANVADFDRLFRANLRALYTSLGLAPPSTLELPLSHGTGAPAHGGTMRKSSPPE
jgi:alpha-amylase/alpha-mannosidase (GH57 family)